MSATIGSLEGDRNKRRVRAGGWAFWTQTRDQIARPFAATRLDAIASPDAGLPGTDDRDLRMTGPSRPGTPTAAAPTRVRWRIFLLMLMLIAINYIDRASISVAMPVISQGIRSRPRRRKDSF